ncbi:MAG: hypothetical protein ACRDHF_18920 [Tepidiformaceae bacterium]
MPPSPVQQAFVLWLVAIAAGLFETLVIVIASDESGAGLAAGVIVRVAVFALAVYLAVRMRAGQNWARIALTGLLGVLGLLSLLIGPVTWLIDGNTLSDLDLSTSETLFAISRVVHVVSVVLAVTLMYLPAANRWFQGPRLAAT